MLTDPRNPPIAGHESAWSEASNVKHLIPFCARSYSDSFCYSYFMFELKSTAQASLFQFVYLDYSSTSRRLHHTWLIQEWDTYFTHRDNSAGTGDPAYGKRWVSHGMRRIREYLRLHVNIFCVHGFLPYTLSGADFRYKKIQNASKEDRDWTRITFGLHRSMVGETSPIFEICRSRGIWQRYYRIILLYE